VRRFVKRQRRAVAHYNYSARTFPARSHETSISRAALRAGLHHRPDDGAQASTDRAPGRRSQSGTVAYRRRRLSPLAINQATATRTCGGVRASRARPSDMPAAPGRGASRSTCWSSRRRRRAVRGVVRYIDASSHRGQRKARGRANLLATPDTARKRAWCWRITFSPAPAISASDTFCRSRMRHSKPRSRNSAFAIPKETIDASLESGAMKPPSQSR